MCGIAGIIALKEKTLPPSFIISMTNTLKNRGPDDEGFLAVNFREKTSYSLAGDDTKISLPHISKLQKEATLYFGHRRLSIIDLSVAGHQPMSSRDGSLWIIYNGEIYNYCELRDELIQLGYGFKSATDTEVVLAAYEFWGKDCVNKFNGMWSFVIYDSNKSILFGSRDRFGVKPFYYYFDNTLFVFASEIKAILQIPTIKKQANDKAIFDYLVLQLDDPAEESMFKNIFELLPSHCFEFSLNDKQLKIWKYYDLSWNHKWENVNQPQMEEYVQNIGSLIKNAVQLRLQSDVPVGTCLSGGIDSSSIVSVINKFRLDGKAPSIGLVQKTFTACYENLEIDERKWAQIIIQKSNTSWHRVFPDAKSLLHDLEDMIYTQDVPFGSTSIYAQYRVMKLAKENGIKVLLDGQGGDELFAGYTAYYRIFFAEIIAQSDFHRLITEMSNLKNSPIKPISLLSSLFRMYASKIFPNCGRKTLFHQNVLRGIQPTFFKKHNERLNTLKEFLSASLNQNLAKLMFSASLKQLLRYEDRNSMRFSIEARTPFADDVNLIEYVFNVPSSYKIYNGWSKYLLRMAMAGFLPEEIRWRKDKIGFATPEHNWLYSIKNELSYYITDNLNDYIDTKTILSNWDRILDQQKSCDITWRIINLAIWKKIWNI